MQLKSFYDYFDSYSKEEINKAFESLCMEDKELIIKKFGKDLIGVLSPGLLSKEVSKIYYIINKKMPLLLNGNFEVPVKRGKFKTFYQYFTSYSEDEVDKAFLLLSDEEKRLIIKKFGENLCENNLSDITNKENYRIINTIRRRMPVLLSSDASKIINNRKVKTFYELFTNFSKEEIDEAFSLLTNRQKEIVRKKYGEDLETPVLGNLSSYEAKCLSVDIKTRIIRTLADNEYRVKLQKKYGTLSSNPASTTNEVNQFIKEDYLNMLKFVKGPAFTKLIETFSTKEAVIIILKFGYIDGKYFSTEAISKFLQVEPNEINIITKKALLLFKNTINNMLDSEIDKFNEEKSKKLL